MALLRINYSKCQAAVQNARHIVSYKQNGCNFANNIFKNTGMNENLFVSNLTEFVPKDLVDNKSSLVKILAWGRADLRITHLTGAYISHPLPVYY